jgi:hypothetical protein
MVRLRQAASRSGYANDRLRCAVRRSRGPRVQQIGVECAELVGKRTRRAIERHENGRAKARFDAIVERGVFSQLTRDPAAAGDEFTGVKYGALPWSHRALRFVEANSTVPSGSG